MVFIEIMTIFFKKSQNILWERFPALQDYPTILEKMRQKTLDIREKNTLEEIWFLEHPPLFTAGTSAKKEHLFNPNHYPTYDAGRGGEWTYHGPGQRIAYLMLDLEKKHGPIAAKDIRSYVHSLEEWLKISLKMLDIDCMTYPERIGIWCHDPILKQEAKIAALGIRISRWVSWHGIALNIHPHLEDFKGIVPCGLANYGVTALSHFHPGIKMEEVDEILFQGWQKFMENPPSSSSF